MSKLLNVLPRYRPHAQKMSVPKDVQESGYHYRTANPKSERIEFLKMLGYEVVTKKEGGKDVPYRVGSSVLVRCKTEEYERRANQRLQIAQARTTAPRERVKELGARHGVEVIDETRTFQGTLEAGMSDNDE